MREEPGENWSDSAETRLKQTTGRAPRIRGRKSTKASWQARNITTDGGNRVGREWLSRNGSVKRISEIVRSWGAARAREFHVPVIDAAMIKKLFRGRENSGF